MRERRVRKPNLHVSLWKNNKRKIMYLSHHINPLSYFCKIFVKAKIEKQFKKFVKILKKLYINITFTKTLSQMAYCAKFLKKPYQTIEN